MVVDRHAIRKNFAKDEKGFKISLATAIASSKVMQHYANVDTSKRPIRLKMIKTLMEEKESGEFIEVETKYKNLAYTNEKRFEIAWKPHLKGEERAKPLLFHMAT